jgi:hypothetical protein
MVILQGEIQKVHIGKDTLQKNLLHLQVKKEIHQDKQRRRAVCSSHLSPKTEIDQAQPQVYQPAGWSKPAFWPLSS